MIFSAWSTQHCVEHNTPRHAPVSHRHLYAVGMRACLSFYHATAPKGIENFVVHENWTKFRSSSRPQCTVAIQSKYQCKIQLIGAHVSVQLSDGEFFSIKSENAEPFYIGQTMCLCWRFAAGRPIEEFSIDRRNCPHNTDSIMCERIWPEQRTVMHPINYSI